MRVHLKRERLATVAVGATRAAKVKVRLEDA
jgi:hypothetical protein